MAVQEADQACGPTARRALSVGLMPSAIVRSISSLVLVLPIALAAQSCPQPELHLLTQQAKIIQSALLGTKLADEMDESVPAPLQLQIRAFKDALTSLADAAVRCGPANVDPKGIENSLAILVATNKPQTQEVYDPNKPPQLDHIYGDNLVVKITRPASQAQLLLVEFNFGIDCGFDSLLLAYEYRDNEWKQALRWQNSTYDRVDAAFGDFFDYVVLPEQGPNGWRIAVAHGHPWCTSRWSGFDLDLIQPASQRSAQVTLQHIEHGYVRFEVEPTLKLVPDGFQIRLQTGMIDMDIMTRIGIYRYLVKENQIERVQPIANNGRDFVDEWLQSPWNDSARWSKVANLAQLEQAHEKIAYLRDPNAKDQPLLTFGSVRGC
ncbi:MAG TPA: hypothetical protein VFD98_12440, partial [Terracidiphilus sp.]|nr:hypothetical protein [Terracidiphilus sp.]